MSMNNFIKQFIGSAIKRERAMHEAPVNSEVLSWLEMQDRRELVLTREALGGNGYGRVFSVNGGITWHKSIRTAVLSEMERQYIGI